MGTIIIESVAAALQMFEEAAMKRAKAIEEGKYKVANREFDKLVYIVIFLRGHKSLHELSVFYKHPNIGVRKTASAYLLPVNEKESIRVLKEIANMKVVGSLDAEMTIKEWKNGNLRNFYTL